MTTTELETRAKLALEITDGLRNFRGGDQIYKHWLPIRYTAGVKYLADKAGAHWLIDLVASYQPSRKLRENQRLQEFQLWELTVNLTDQTAVATCREDSDEPAVITQEIPYTDFPLEYVKLYLDEGGVLLLPGEH